MTRRLPILLAAMLFVPAVADAADSLGRLFFTPERRAALERQRQLNIQEEQTLEGATMSLDGVVVRSSGKRTVWINRQAQHDDASPTGVAVDLSAREPGRATLSAGEEAPAQLKVGESINRATREKGGDLAGGRIGIGKSRASAGR
jgi:hypothetical protein